MVVPCSDNQTEKNRQVYSEYTKPAGYTIVMAKEHM